MPLSRIIRPSLDNIYEQKKAWKRWLLLAALIIVGISLWYTSWLENKIAIEEKGKITTWANAIRNRAELVNYTEEFFAQLRAEERKRAEGLAEATRQLMLARPGSDMDYYQKILEENSTIPVILTDEAGNINYTRNVDFDLDTVPKLTEELRKEFSVYEPITLNYFANRNNYFWYKDSKHFQGLQKVINDLVSNFFTEVVNNSASVPVIITDNSRDTIIACGNVDSLQICSPTQIRHTIAEMAASNDPIRINIVDQERLIFYKNSFVLTQLKYFPYIQLAIIGLFLLIAYTLFSAARRTEQNQVWAGMAKETAHQLGTPISSLMAWVEYLKMQEFEPETVLELEKDVNRLNTIAGRFSKIGSKANLRPENVVEMVHSGINYLKPRISNRIKYVINPGPEEVILANIDRQLIDWVLENLVKNGADAMAGKGTINIDVFHNKEHNVVIDVSDTGKGVAKGLQRSIFDPGYTSKRRGWGLGLTLSKRIVNDIHGGEIFVKSSTLGKGSTFRIILPGSDE